MRLFLIALVLAGLYMYVIKPYRAEQAKAEIQASMVPNANGFVSLPAAFEMPDDKITIFAAINCPKEGAQRADRLAESLRSQGIPYQRISRVSFSLDGVNDKAEFDTMVAKFNSVMEGDAPVVLIGARAQANPSLDKVLAEYRASR